MFAIMSSPKVEMCDRFGNNLVFIVANRQRATTAHLYNR